MEGFVFFNINLLNVIREVPIDNKTTLVHIMAWHRIGDKLVFEPMLNRFNDACMRDKEEMHP